MFNTKTYRTNFKQNTFLPTHEHVQNLGRDQNLDCHQTREKETNPSLLLMILQSNGSRVGIKITRAGKSSFKIGKAHRRWKRMIGLRSSRLFFIKTYFFKPPTSPIPHSITCGLLLIQLLLIQWSYLILKWFVWWEIWFLQSLYNLFFVIQSMTLNWCKLHTKPNASNYFIQTGNSKYFE